MAIAVTQTGIASPARTPANLGHEPLLDPGAASAPVKEIPDVGIQLAPDAKRT